ncbi:MAG: hypothetical protein AAB632_03350 [Patescibacteria group bacterium]
MALLIFVLLVVVAFYWRRANKKKNDLELLLKEAEEAYERRGETISFLRYGLYEAELPAQIDKDRLPANTNLREAYVRVVPEEHKQAAGVEFDYFSAFPKRPQMIRFFVASEGHLNLIFSELRQENSLYEIIATATKELC